MKSKLLIAEPLIEWFSKNARILPWRSEPTAYRVWISEIMLQQTRVEAVKPYFDAFITALPTVRHLAEAPSEQVMKLWEGLGYYSRARNLQKAAQLIMQEYDGNIPSDVPSLLRLPGIGEYTAGAIASIAFQKPVPAIDGNVLRVMSRLLDCHDKIDLPQTKRAFSKLLQSVYPQDNPGDMTQALMELGAIVCVPGQQPPKCNLCPLAYLCLAKERDTAALLPVKQKKKPRAIQDFTVLLLFHGGKFALQKRPSSGLLASLWQYPTLFGHQDETSLLSTLADWGMAPLSLRPLPDAQHIFTHLEWHMKGYFAEVSDAPSTFVWETPQNILADYAIPSAFKVYVRAMKDEIK